MNKNKLETIPLIIYSNESGKYLPDIKVFLDGVESRFLFDTGAAASQVKLDEHTKKYENLGAKESKGASGIAVSQEIIKVSEIRFGQRVFKDFRLERGGRSIFGVDFLRDLSIEIDLKDETLSIIDDLSGIDNVEEIVFLKSGHLTIPLKICERNSYCLFDTGADSTVIDEKYIRENASCFKLLKTEDGEDAHGHKIPSNVYQCRELKIGHLHLQNVEVAGFEFGDHLRAAMENVPIILGNNVIYGSKWSFDFKAKTWCSCSSS